MRGLRQRGALFVPDAPGAVRSAGPAMLKLAPKAEAGPLLMAHAFVVALMMAGAVAWDFIGGEGGYWLTPLSVLTLVLTGWMLWSWHRVHGTLFDPYGLFIVAASAFNGGYALLRVLGADQDLYRISWYSDAHVFSTLFLIALSLAVMHAGALAAVAWGKGKGEVARSKWAVEEDHEMRLVGIVLLVLAVGPVLLSMKEALEVVMTSGYLGLYERGVSEGAGDTVVRIFASFFVPGTLFLLAGSRYWRVGQVLSLVALLMYAFTQFALGFRGYAVLPLLAYVWIYHRCIRRLPLSALGLVGTFIIVFVFPLVRHTRHLTGSDRFDVSILLESYFSLDNPLIALLTEVSSTFLSVADTVALVPQSHPFDWGMSYVFALANALPILKTYQLRPYQGLGDWLTWQVLPQEAAMGVGTAFTFIAEAYFNFGWFGGPLLVGLMGFGVVRFILWAERSADPAKLVVVAFFMTHLLFFARGESITLSRPMLWYALVPYLAILLLRHFRSRLAPPPLPVAKHESSRPAFVNPFHL